MIKYFKVFYVIFYVISLKAMGMGKEVSWQYLRPQEMLPYFNYDPFLREACAQQETRDLSIVSEPALKKYKCTWPGCEKTFKHKNSLVVHMRIHKGESPYLCNWPGCNRTFNYKESLQRHMLSHTKERPYVCSWFGCDKRFTQKSFLKRHIQKIHGREQILIDSYLLSSLHEKNQSPLKDSKE